VAVKENPEAAARLLEQHEHVEAVTMADRRIVVTLKQDADDYSELPSWLIQQGYKLTLFREEDVSLESAFMALTKGMGSKT
jgi:ABC-2 type transport system ATP-binding protein